MPLLYIGPGAGFAFMGAFLALFLALLAGLLSLLLWPLRMSVRWLKGRRAYRQARVRRLVIVGFDGYDPQTAERLMAAGRLPHLKALAAQGGYRRLRTTTPPVSPVAWSSFATGVDPSRHNIFDFLNRNPRTYFPELSSSRIRPPRRMLRLGSFRFPLSRARVELLRKSIPFWKTLGEHHIPSTILRVPITFPPDRFRGFQLSAMCAPDLLGTQGTFSFFTTREMAGARFTQGSWAPLTRRGEVLEGELLGPPDPFTAGGETLRLPFRLRQRGGEHQIEVGGQTHRLQVGRHSEWLPLRFRSRWGFSVRGIARAVLTRADEEVELYVTPINVDPENPVLPISHPSTYAIYLAKLLGSYATLGLAEDTWAMNEGVLDEDAFLEQVYLIHAEREAMLFNAMKKTTSGVVVCVFDASDRIQHMFLRCAEPDHPANRQRDAAAYAHVVDEMYCRMDELVGRVRASLDPRTALLVLSDHGFTSFRRGVDLNAWLMQEGYLALQEGCAISDEFFGQVDWSRTRAYAMGLGGIFINQRGRERHGIVGEGEETRALQAEIAGRLAGLSDEARAEVAIRKVQPIESLFQGPFLDAAPDLVVGYNRGYRTSWGCTLGRVSAEVFSDNVKAWGGDHCVAPELVPGVLFSSLPIKDDDPGIMDLAPSTLALFGVQPGRQLDGRVIL